MEFSNDGSTFFQALKSRLVAGGFFEFLPYFARHCEAKYFCPPICPPRLTLRVGFEGQSQNQLALSLTFT
jgi:hypothetical protein